MSIVLAEDGLAAGTVDPDTSAAAETGVDTGANGGTCVGTDTGGSGATDCSVGGETGGRLKIFVGPAPSGGNVSALVMSGNRFESVTAAGAGVI